MGDRGAAGYFSSWNTNFYHQYFQQHARLTQWLQNLDQLSQASLCHQNYSSSQYYPHQNWQQPILHQENDIPQQMHHDQPILHQGYYYPEQIHHDQHQRHSLRNSRPNSYAHHRSRSETSFSYSRDGESDRQEEGSETESSECELVLNTDAILAFRTLNNKPVEEVEEKEEVQLVEATLNEKFEYVILDEDGQLGTVLGKPDDHHTKEDGQYDKESKILLYGDKADRIAGLETSLEITFDHIKDLNTPMLYPM